MSGVLIKDGAVVIRAGAVVLTDDPANCSCCGGDCSRVKWFNDLGVEQAASFAVVSGALDTLTTADYNTKNLTADHFTIKYHFAAFPPNAEYPFPHSTEETIVGAVMTVKEVQEVTIEKSVFDEPAVSPDTPIEVDAWADHLPGLSDYARTTLAGWMPEGDRRFRISVSNSGGNRRFRLHRSNNGLTPNGTHPSRYPFEGWSLKVGKRASVVTSIYDLTVIGEEDEYRWAGTFDGQRFDAAGNPVLDGNGDPIFDANSCEVYRLCDDYDTDGLPLGTQSWQQVYDDVGGNCLASGMNYYQKVHRVYTDWVLRSSSTEECPESTQTYRVCDPAWEISTHRYNGADQFVSDLGHGGFYRLTLLPDCGGYGYQNTVFFRAGQTYEIPFTAHTEAHIADPVQDSLSRSAPFLGQTVDVLDISGGDDVVIERSCKTHIVPYGGGWMEYSWVRASASTPPRPGDGVTSSSGAPGGGTTTLPPTPAIPGGAGDVTHAFLDAQLTGFGITMTVPWAPTPSHTSYGPQ